MLIDLERVHRRSDWKAKTSRCLKVGFKMRAMLIPENVIVELDDVHRLRDDVRRIEYIVAT